MEEFMAPIKEISIIGILFIIKKNAKLFLFNFLAILFLITIISFVIPVKYSSKALILPPEETIDPLLYGYSGIGEGMTSQFSQALLGGSVVSEIWASILCSRSVLVSIAYELNLFNLWQIKNTEDAVEKLKSVLSTNISPEGLININVTTEDPVLSRDIAVLLIDNLDSINNTLLQTYAHNRRVFLEKRLNQITDSINILRDSLLEFSIKNKIVNLEVEGSVILTLLGDLRAKEIILESELSGLSSEMTPNHPNRKALEASLNSIRWRIKQIEQTGGVGLGLGFSQPLESLPFLEIQYIRIKGNLNRLNSLYGIVYTEYERSKIAELKDMPVLKVIDWPTIPEEKSWPKRSIFVIIGGFIGLSIGILSAIFKDYSDSYLKNEENRSRLVSLIYKW